MFSAILAATLLWHADPRVVAVLEGDEFARFGIVADLVERPAGLTNQAFAQQLIDEEGLQSWNGKQLSAPATDGRMGSEAVYAADGREIIVKYVAGDSKRPGRVCRLRLARVGMSVARLNAYRWCAAAFGLSLPAAPPPPIAGVTKRPRR